MKLHTERSEVERSGVSTESAFRIKTTAKAFDILSSGLYTDNIAAIIRELSCNAYDAHVEAGKKDIPFELHLPNKLEPWFHVRDYGVGLSDEDVHGLYTTYFDSTKTDSNDYIGALGLGSKSPFSYTNAFEVISRYNGVRRIYSIFLNEDGIPSVSKLGEFPTEEHNGLEVKLTVKEGDFREFAFTAKRVLRWFKTKPQILGYPQFEYEPMPERYLEGDRWKLLPRSYRDPRMTAVQGNVSYVVNIDQLDLDRDVRDVLDEGHLVGFFEIGELEVAASREEIRYDERSKQAIMKLIDTFRSQLVDKIEKDIPDNTTDYWDTFIEINQMVREMFGSTYSFRRLMEGKVKTNVLVKYIDQNGSVEIPEVNGYDIYMYKPGRYSLSQKLSRYPAGRAVKPEDDLAVFVNDVSKGGVARMSEFILTSSFNKILCIREKKNATKMVQTKNGQLSERKLSQKDYKNEFKKIFEFLGNPKVHRVSTDTSEIKQKKAAEKTLPVFTYGKLVGRSYYDDRVEWSRVNEFDIDEGGVYVYLRNRANLIKETKQGVKKLGITGRYVKTFLDQAANFINSHYKDYDISTDNIFAVGSQVKSKLEKRNNWKELFDLIIPLASNYQEVWEIHMRMKETPNVLGIKDLVTNDKFIKRVKSLDKSSSFRKKVEPFIELYKQHVEHYATVDFLRNVELALGVELFDNRQIVPFFEDMSEYPMLEYVEEAPALDLVFDYIKLVDRSK